MRENGILEEVLNKVFSPSDSYEKNVLLQKKKTNFRSVIISYRDLSSDQYWSVTTISFMCESKENLLGTLLYTPSSSY